MYLTKQSPVSAAEGSLERRRCIKTFDHGQDDGVTSRCRKPSNKIYSNVGPSLDKERVEIPVGSWVVFPQAHNGEAAMKDLMFWDIEGHQNRCLTRVEA